MAAAEISQNAADPALGQAIVLYDGLCPLCRRSVRSLKRLDWLKRFQFQDCRDTANLPRTAVPLDPAQLLEQMHVVTPNRKRAYAGFRAFRWMAWRIPVTWWLAPFLYLPGMRWLGTRLYRWVARNRFKLVPCSDGACAVPRVRESGVRSQESERDL
jgi:predicted DCC family thiol-disulfide oxidoreductase YuxK